MAVPVAVPVRGTGTTGRAGRTDGPAVARTGAGGAPARQGPPPERPAGRRTAPRRRNPAERVLRALLVLGVLAVAAVLVAPVVDDAAERAVTSRLETELRAEASAADVDVVSQPFLTQAARGRYEQVDVELLGLRARSPQGDDVVVRRLDATLRDVEAPLGDVVRDQLDVLVVGEATGRLEISDDALTAALAARLDGAADVDLTAEEGALRVTLGLPDLPLVPEDVSVRAAVELADGVVALSVLPEDLARLPGPLQAPVDELLRARLDLPPLPYGLEVRRGQVTDGLVLADLEARDVTVPLRSPASTG